MDLGGKQTEELAARPRASGRVCLGCRKKDSPMLGNFDRLLPLPALLHPLEGRSWDAAVKEKCWKLF